MTWIQTYSGRRFSLTEPSARFAQPALDFGGEAL